MQCPVFKRKEEMERKSNNLLLSSQSVMAGLIIALERFRVLQLSGLTCSSRLKGNKKKLNKVQFDPGPRDVIKHS